MAFKCEMLKCIICNNLPAYKLQVINVTDYLIENENAEILGKLPLHYSDILIREAIIGCKNCKKTVSMINDDISFNEMYENLVNSWNRVCNESTHEFWLENK